MLSTVTVTVMLIVIGVVRMLVIMVQIAIVMGKANVIAKIIVEKDIVIVVTGKALLSWNNQ